MWKNRLKQIAKRLLGRPDLKTSSEDYGRAQGALKIFVDEHKKYLLQNNHLPPRADGKPYHSAIAKMEPDYNFFASDVFARNPEHKPVFEYDNFHSGTPLKYKPFPGAMREVRKALRRKNLYWYPRSAGGFYSQQKVVDYLVREGFEPNPMDLEGGEVYGGLGVNNIVFSYSTTHAYSLIMDAVAKPGDVILMTAPNYGLFAIMTELDDYRTELLDLKEEDDWQVNPTALAKRIDELNAKLAQEASGGGYVPRVAAFLNLNPHNPTGKVVNHKNLDILRGIGEVCKERNIFVIDDLVYRDLTYDLDDLAVPLASLPEYFNNTISLFGLSKAYELASFRAAVIVAPAAVAEVLAREIHDSVDSMSVLQVTAVTGAFNGTNRRYREHRRYMRAIIREYKFRYNLMYALVYGVSKIKDRGLRRKIVHTVKRYIKSSTDRQIVLSGCRGLKIRKGTEPESGFFAVFDFTELKGKTTPKGVTIRTERELLEHFFVNGGVTYLMGGNICWPYPDEMVGRISFAVSRKAICKNMLMMNKAIRSLK